jgi:hypothetical protein
MVKCINSSAHFTDIYSRKETLTITSTSTHHGMMETEQGQQKKNCYAFWFQKNLFTAHMILFKRQEGIFEL